MPSAGEEARRIGPADRHWPTRLQRLGGDAPDSLDLVGNEDLLLEPPLAIFCSLLVPGRAVVESYSFARGLAATGATVVGGFQSPIERDVLDYLLRGCASVILCPARGIRHLSIPRCWRSPLREGRLLLLSSFPEEIRRPTAEFAERRNRIAAALASRIMILHATQGGRLFRLAVEAAGWGVPMHCLDHPRNEDLRLIGAIPLLDPSRTRE